MAELKTPEQLADERRRDVMAFAYKDKDGKYYTVDAGGNRVETTLGATLADGTKVQALSPEYQKIADQTAAIAMLYSKVLAVEPAERSALMQAIKNISEGRQVAQDKFTEVARPLSNLLKDVGLSIPGAGVASTVGGAISDVSTGFTLPFTFFSELLGAGKDMVSQFGGNEISRENAMAIGIAYASARQAAASGRPLDPSLGDYFSGLFSKNFGSYLGAGLAWLLDKVVGFLEHIPGIGEWVKKQGWSKNLSLGEHLERHSRGDDNLRVEHEMTKLPKIGGRDSKEVAEALNRGSATALLPSGEQATVHGADKDNKAPSMTLPNGEPAPQTMDAAERTRNLMNRPLLDRLAGAADRSDFSGTRDKYNNSSLVGLGTGLTLVAGATVQTARGVAEGYARSEIKNGIKDAEKAEQAHDKAKAKAEKLEAKANGAAQSGTKTAREISKIEAELATAKQAEAAAKLKAEKAFENATNRAANKSRWAESGLQKMGDWEHFNGVKRLFVDSWRGVGRLVGDGLSKLDHIHMPWASTDLQILSKVADKSPQVAKIGQTISEFAVKNVKWLKFGKGVPLVGAGAAAATMAFVPGAHAETVNGQKLNMREQLTVDYVTGRISPEKYNTYRMLQDNYALTGAGGLITAGIAELGQDTLSELDKASMLRYLPESLLDMARNQKIAETSAPQAQVLSAAEREARLAQVQAKSPLEYLKMLVPFASLYGAMDRVVDWDQVKKAVEQASKATTAAPVEQKVAAAPLTNEQLVAAHEGVIQQARAATKVTAKPLINFNLGVGFAKVDSTGIGTLNSGVLPAGDGARVASSPQPVVG